MQVSVLRTGPFSFFDTIHDANPHFGVAGRRAGFFVPNVFGGFFGNFKDRPMDLCGLSSGYSLTARRSR
jgi:hypothetical protein